MLEWQLCVNVWHRTKQPREYCSLPTTGRRNESALEAIPGLGEALVSEITEPDRYVVSRKNGEMTIKDKRIGAKSKAILAADGGGVKEEIISCIV